MGLGKFISNASKAAGKTSKVAAHTAEHAAASTVKTAVHTVKQAGSRAAVTAGKTISATAHTVGKVGIGKVTVGNITKAGTHAGIGNANLANASKELSKAIHKVSSIPVLGSIIGATTGLHLVSAVNDIANGQRVDRAAINTLKKKIGDYKAVAPYAASVVSFVPGIGPGVGAGIAAGAALAEGKRWSEVAIEAAKGAIPGGNIAKAVFDATQAAVRGKSIDQIGIAALPIDDKSKAAITAAVALTKDLASGKRVDQALFARVNDALAIAGVKGKTAQLISSGAKLAKGVASGQRLDRALMDRVDDAMKLAGPEILKAVQVGAAIGTARKLQDTVMKAIAAPQAVDALQNLGHAEILKNAVLQKGISMSNSPEFRKGFQAASGLMSGKKIDEAMILGLRNSLPGEARKGFDSATSYFIGKNEVAKKPPGKRNPPPRKGVASKTATPEQSFAYFATHGVVGAAEGQKTALVQTMADSSPEMREGASDAIRAVAAERAGMTKKEKSWWDKLIAFFTGG